MAKAKIMDESFGANERSSQCEGCARSWFEVVQSDWPKVGSRPMAG